MDYDNNPQRTVIAYVVGLLCGGLLVWAFSGDEQMAKEIKDEPNIREEVVQHCMKKGGVPILDGGNKLTDCKGI